ncbi:hypothetical protein O6H91_01G005300 [Diphasiastrum complanatum]|uniref:Uncharacterized protein n=1 Tax=Diphasiastrum complanatum TaxID=34168 RepID=A0ACC2EMU4_DIPCM|nr:hypothetical protein O6H91_01G005300 [Diphasiastrum complanatum]
MVWRCNQLEMTQASLRDCLASPRPGRCGEWTRWRLNPIESQEWRTMASPRPKTLARNILAHDHMDIGWAKYGLHWRHVCKICQLELFTSKRMEASKHVRTHKLLCMLKSILEKSEGGEAMNVNSQVFA